MSRAMLRFLIISVLLNQASFCVTQSNYSFSYPSFDHGSCGSGSSLICMGSVKAGNGSLSITPLDQDRDRDRESQKKVESDPNHHNNEVGRVLHNQSVLAWPATFSTSFTVRILKDLNLSNFGDGMAFIMAQDDKSSPPESYGLFLGILNQSTQGGKLHQLAVELDTYKNENDPDANHVAIDTTSVAYPVAQKSLNSTGIDLKSGREITFRIDYDGWEKLLHIYVGYVGDPLVCFLSHQIIMKKTVPSSVYVGFTGSTGTYAEDHQVLSWNFTTYELPKKSLNSGEENKIRNIMLKVVVPIMGAILLLFAAFGLAFVLRARTRRKGRFGRNKDIEMLSRNAANAPRMFTHRQLSKATHNFSKENLLGTGGFGSVYKGVISDPPSTIAVKRISATSKQGEREYLAEICTIGRLRHKNLLQIQGWCHEYDNLLLVYDYMPNGSLDRFIGKGQFLDWKTRYKILTGLASALVYLHEECGNPVVHRDVKPNNVMLDSEYNAHLGDFGLARLLQNDTSITTMIAGTPGYLAPEVSFTGRATPESDVYSFGMVVLELVCGRRSKGFMDDDSLMDGVWSVYEKDAMVDCADKKLEGNFDEEQVKRSLIVGLSCLHPDYTFRPRMRKVVQIFMNPDEPLMNLPESRPSAICLSFHSSSATTTTTDFASSTAPLTRGSMESLLDEI